MSYDEDDDDDDYYSDEEEEPDHNKYCDGEGDEAAAADGDDDDDDDDDDDGAAVDDAEDDDDDQDMKLQNTSVWVALFRIVQSNCVRFTLTRLFSVDVCWTTLGGNGCSACSAKPLVWQTQGV